MKGLEPKEYILFVVMAFLLLLLFKMIKKSCEK